MGENMTQPDSSTKSRKYRGIDILPVDDAEMAGKGYRWMVPSWSDPGKRWKQYAKTLARAKEIINLRMRLAFDDFVGQ